MTDDTSSDELMLLGGSDDAGRQRSSMAYNSSGSYQNNGSSEIRSNEEDGCNHLHVAGRLVGDEIDATTDHRFSSFFRGKLPFALAALAVVALYGVTQRPAVLSYEYADMLKGKSRNFVRAQGIAQASREVFLGESSPPEESSHDKKHKKHSKDEHDEPPVGCEGTVLLLRHCEKEHNYEHCAYTGFERSLYLPTLFGNDDERWPSPSKIFALNPGERATEWKQNYREVETILPLAEKANVTINAEYGAEETSKLAKHIHKQLRSGEMCGKLTVVSWKHEDLPKLAHRLGCGPIEGCPLDYSGRTFDEVWQIKFVYLIPTHATTKHQAKKDIKPTKPRWWVFGSTQHEGFDPLAYSKQAGDYPDGGTDSGGRWRPHLKDEKLQELHHDKLQFPSP